MQQAQQESAGRLLIADDEETFLSATCDLLSLRGYECHCAQDASAVFDKLEALEFDAIIADIKMPGNEELEMLERIAESPSEAALVIVTGYPSLKTAIESVNLHVDAYLVKPFEIEDLCQKIQRSVAATRSLRRIRAIADKFRSSAASLETLAQATTDTPTAPIAGPMAAAFDVAFDGIISLLINLRNLLTDLAAGDTHSAGYRLFSDPAFLSAAKKNLGERADLEPLSARERELLWHLIEGSRVPAIAEALHISQNTVRNHLKSIFRKLGVSSQSELLELFKR